MESFEAYAHQGLTKLYGISGGVKIQSTVQRILADINEGQGFADDEYYYLTEDERDEAYDSMEFDAESFDAEGVPEGFHRMPDGTIMADSAHGAESQGDKVRFELIPSVKIEGVGIVSEGSPYLKNWYGEWDEYTIYDDDAAEAIFEIDAKSSRMPLQEGELELITAMVYGFNHPLAGASWGELNERRMFWAAKTMEELANYDPYEAEEFGAETCPMCENENPIIGGEVCAECTQYLEDEQDRFSQRTGAESFGDESPMMKNITVIGAFALAIIIGKKLKR